MADKEYLYAKYGIPFTSSGNRTGVPPSHSTIRHSGPANPHIRSKSEHRGEARDMGRGRAPQFSRAKPFGSRTDLHDPRTTQMDHLTSRRDVRQGRRGIQPIAEKEIHVDPYYKYSGGISQFPKNPKRSDGQSSILNIGREVQRNNGREQGREQLHENKPRMDTIKARTRSEQNLLDLPHDSGSRVRSGKPDFCRTSDPKSTRSFQARDGNRGFQGERRLDFRSLREISLLEPSEIIMKLAAPRSGLCEALNQSGMPHSLMELILEVLNKAIGCRSSRQNLLHLLGNVQGSAFMKEVLPFYLLGADKMDQQEQTQEMLPVISYILTLLLELISIFPSSCAMEVSLVETLLQNTVSQLCSKGISIPDAITKNLINLHTFLQHLQEKKREGTLRSDNYTYLKENEDSSSTNDFRQMSIFPTHDDIFLTQNPKMRPNIISKVYPDANAYLDTHFRLLREDFIRPLRDGISQLLGMQGKELMRARFDDIRVYFNAVIIMSVCTHAGIVHQIQFSIKNLTGIRWESSKRLLFGALVCLSKDHFETMLFATVADRNEKELAKGIITLKFTDESRLSLAKMKSNDSFIMVETNAYFEAYRHVLEGLKEMGGSEIPLQKYIVRCEADVLAPAYLKQNRAAYTLKTLVTDQSLALKQKPVSNSSDDDSGSEDDSRNYNQGFKSLKGEAELSTLMERLLGNLYTKKDTPCQTSGAAGKPGVRFDVLDFKTWPSKEALKLDRSQLKAFQTALTKELSIIQGPPGTGTESN